jgi:predicted Rdx family selenoprotein
MKQLSKLKDLAISETGFVFDPFSGGTFTVNATGQVIFKGLRDGQTPAEIVQRLRAEFDAVGDDVLEEVHDFLRVLKGYGWSSGDAGAP